MKEQPTIPARELDAGLDHRGVQTRSRAIVHGLTLHDAL